MLQVSISVFKITQQNKLVTIYTPAYWQDPDANKEVEKLIEQGKLIQIELHVNKVNKRGLVTKVGVIADQSSDLGGNPKRSELFKASKNMKHIGLEDMVFSRKLYTMKQIINEIKNIIVLSSNRSHFHLG